MATQHFELQGLHCSSCVMHLEGLEEDLEGVKKAEVNFKAQTMQVEFDESKQSVKDIVRAVSEMGYIAIPAAGNDVTHGAEGAGEAQGVKPAKKPGSVWSKLFR